MLLSEYYKLVELTVVTVLQASGAVVTVFHVLAMLLLLY